MNLLSASPVKVEQNLRPAHQPVIKVLGLGGGGSNAVDRMMSLGIKGVDFIVANTDRQALMRSKAPSKIQLGPNYTRGLGAGGRPSVARKRPKRVKKKYPWRCKGQTCSF